MWSLFFFSSRRRHTRCSRDWSSDVCSSDLAAGANGKLAVLASTPLEPAEVFALDGTTLRPLSRQNDAWLSRVRLGPVEPISFKSRDGTAINGFVVKPPDFVAGKRYPTILRIHRGAPAPDHKKLYLPLPTPPPPRPF